MKITVEHYSETITVETPEEITADDFVDLLYRLGIMVGYQEQSMADACAGLAETYYAHDKIEINPDACLKDAYAEIKHIKQQPPVTDKERLDWLLSTQSGYAINGLGTREEIDKAMNQSTQ